jgi:5-phospho-D-xylono-1,4-lactonase
MTTLRAVTGPIDSESIRCAEAHGHLWIERGVDGGPVLDDESASAAELADFASHGGGLVLDCQPGSCGRDGRILSRLASSSSVAIVASTGFHLQKYYGLGCGPWYAGVDVAESVFRSEVCEGLPEAPEVRAGSIKTAWTGAGGDEEGLMIAALSVARATGTGVTVHTEKGERIEELAALIEGSGLSPGRIQLSHVDKRPDPQLHFALARSGFVLGYDTFLRPKYEPERTAWPLLRAMLAEGLHRHVAIGLDVVDRAIWHVDGGPGLRSITEVIVPRLRSEGATEAAIEAMVAGNICRVLGGDERHEATL